MSHLEKRRKNMVTREATKLTRRQMLKFAGGTAAVTVLAACGQPAAKPEPAQPQATAAPATEAPAAQAPAATQPVSPAATTLRLWSHNNTAFVKANEDLVKKYQEIHPEVEIKYENFPYADVMTLPQAQELFYAAPLDGYVHQGKLFGLPNEYNLENGAVLVNKTMYEKAGVTYPPAWKTWEELVADAKTLTQWDGDVMKIAGFHYVNNDGLGFLFWEGILERGADYWANDQIHLNLETDQAVATTQWLADMAIKDKVVDPVTFNPNSNWVGDSFFQGLVAIGFIGPWIVPVGRTNYPDFPDTWEYISTPYYGDKMSFAADSGWGKVVSPNSKALNTAWDIAKFWAADNANAHYWNVGTGTVPALKAVAEDPTLLNDITWLGPSLKVLPFGRFVGDLQDRDYVWYNVVATRLTETLQGQHTAQEVCKIMNDEANAMIDSKLKGSQS
jgi:multiple sugar transport system substrate-binding protein